ncbi:MAG TPA: hypothetical protein VF525_08875 [Pyrinomonadaceae bacterium]|jgi:hypothetical protein
MAEKDKSKHPQGGLKLSALVPHGRLSFSWRGLAGVLLCIAAWCLALYAFARLGGVQGDALVVTDYVTQIPRKQECSFGYGGPRHSQSDPEAVSYQTPCVPFQSRVMSAFCFTIERKEDGAYWIKGAEDRLGINGENYDPGVAVKITSGTSFRSSGNFGGASFTFISDEEPDRVRLHLISPLYYRLDHDRTRVTFGPTHEFVGAPVDEVFIRAATDEGGPLTYSADKEHGGDGFVLKQEVDWANPPADSNGEEVKLSTGRQHPFGSVNVRFVGHAPLVGGWVNPGQIFGLKLGVVIALFALVFGYGGFRSTEEPRRLPGGLLLFGCVTLLLVVGMTLTARDYFVVPINQARFDEYSEWSFRALLLLFFLLVPVKHFRQLRWALALPVFFVIYCLLSDPFNGLLSLPSLRQSVGLIVAFPVLAFATHYVMVYGSRLTGYAAQIRWQGIVIPLTLLMVVVMAVAFATGGHSALFLFGVRVHVPTLVLPVMVYCAVLAVVTAEAETVGWLRARTWALSIVVALVGLYYLASEFDHGGTAILGIGVLAAVWAAAKKSPPYVFTAVLVALVAAAVIMAATVVRHERFVIAWGGEEGAEQFFDQAVNLRTARDLARAGGLRGLYEQLYVPSSVRMNIYNDLATAYVAGFFGFVGLLLIMLAYLLFYTGILDVISGAGWARVRARPPGAAAPPKERVRAKNIMPSPIAPTPAERTAPDADREGADSVLRGTLTAYALGLTAAFLFQLLWVFTATLWQKVPFSGLDLQPISASVISVVSFVVILTGSVACVHNVRDSLEPEPRTEPPR